MKGRMIVKKINAAILIDDEYDEVCGEDCPFLIDEVDANMFIDKVFCALFSEQLELFQDSIIPIRCGQCQAIFNPSDGG